MGTLAETSPANRPEKQARKTGLKNRQVKQVGAIGRDSCRKTLGGLYGAPATYELICQHIRQ
jgi:hypothetical protein